jgi:carbamate kinase
MNHLSSGAECFRKEVPDDDLIRPPPIVLAFGGNALLPDPNDPDAQEERAEAFAQALTLLLPERAGIVLVHGNGPQVGMILLRIEATRDRIPPDTLDVMVAATQGSIGYLLSRSLRPHVCGREVAAVMTQVLVDPSDPGFTKPEKPIGPYYDSESAEHLHLSKGWDLVKVPGKGWRRVVPSPEPRGIIELHTIADAVSHGHIVIAGGGGGVPVAASEDWDEEAKKASRSDIGRLRGVEAVIDKDRTAALLAILLAAERLIILTDVPHISKGFGTQSEEPIFSMDVVRATSLLAPGEFPPGSMGPKVEASVWYATTTGRPALITNVESLSEALIGKAGTWITPSAPSSSTQEE